MSAVRLRPLVAALVLALVATVTGVAVVQRRAAADPAASNLPRGRDWLTGLSLCISISVMFSRRVRAHQGLP